MPNLRFPVSLGFAGLLALAAPGLAQEAGQMPPKQVGVVELQSQDVPRVATLPGRAVSSAQAAIRPRVGGIITEILYDPGRPLKAGDPMFQIDPTTYEANLSSAQADVASAKASLAQSQSANQRTEQLLGSGTTQAQVETARATMEQAQASVQRAEAALKLAQAELDWATVTSPIDGMASVAEVSVGDLVTAGQADHLATVIRLDPIEVDMYEPSVRMLAVFNDITAGRLQVTDSLRATLMLETGETYRATGELLAPGFTVSTSTGAIDIRFRFDNPDNLLLPGMFVRGQVELGTTKAVLVSQSAASRDRTGKLSAWVVEDGKAVQRELVDDGTYQNSWIITEGVEPGDMLVVDGRTGLTEGAEVVAVPVSFDDDGVVRDAAPEGEATEGAADDSPADADQAGEAAPAAE
ncbi:efflux RND transporter periplasmic adaptor subunit [Paracoccus caeni]|uniref:Efflux RND transporter periplasmic adaptor subunit n=1 Tax=Paracoccus caeni TaxID=657651 RepID=A0A934S9R0_9RHOB|nr:efflux RND transporter periplasmic adaptor subunit [Paracoccus caeni]MBK4214970.1 efflux RND transporter periplasmic adaptor subunit [Paracoccus caeni]